MLKANIALQAASAPGWLAIPSKYAFATEANGSAIAVFFSKPKPARAKP